MVLSNRALCSSHKSTRIEPCECLNMPKASFRKKTKNSFISRARAKARSLFNKAYVYIIETGGTFACATNEDNLLQPLNHIEALLKKEISDATKFAFFSHPKQGSKNHFGMLLDSINFSYSDKERLAELVANALTQEKSDAIFITHGTDTMADTATFLAQAIPHPSKPIFLFGGMKPVNQKDSDSVNNFLDASIVAKLGSVPPGVYVISNHRIIPAHEVTKIDNSNNDSFRSIRTDLEEYGLVRHIPFRHCIHFRTPKRSFIKSSEEVNATMLTGFTRDPSTIDIPIIELSSNTTPESLRRQLSTQADGFVLKGFGSGAIGRALLSVLFEFAEKVPLVLTSRIPLGTKEQTQYEATEAAKNLWVLPGDGLTPVWAQTKLMFLIAQYTTIKKYDSDTFELTPEARKQIQDHWIADKREIQDGMSSLDLKKKRRVLSKSQQVA